MTTLITGASGFVGLALTEALLARGRHVVGFDLAPLPAMAAQCFSALPGRLDSIVGDVCDGGLLLRGMNEFKVRQLVTLAAVTADEERERASPKLIIDVNAGGVMAALSAASRAGVERVVHASSGAIYGASGRAEGLLDEQRTELQPESLYGISKQAAEAGALRLAHLYGIDLVVGRLGTCFGPWEADTGVRDTLSAPLQVLKIASCGGVAVLPREGRRDWLYVRDVAAGMVALLLQSRLPSPVYNVAAGFEWTIADWCRQIAPHYPGFSWHIAAAGEVANVDYYAPYDRASMSNKRLCSETGFIPRFDLPTAASDFRAWRLAVGIDDR